jgi:ComF family protein
MWEEVKEFISNLLEKLYPSDITCFLSGREVREDKNGLCDKCAKEVEWNDKFCLKCGSPCKSMADYCLHCQNHDRSFEFARAPFVYADKVANAIQEYKYNNKRYLSKPFAKIIKTELDKMLEKGIKIDFITYVPLFKTRQKKRGFNQSELMAKELSKLTKIPLSRNNLCRVKDTITQTSLTFKERQENLDKAFIVKDKTEFKNKNILLIDDVLTTGATAEHCSKALKKAKASSIYVLTLASTDGEKYN